LSDTIRARSCACASSAALALGDSDEAVHEFLVDRRLRVLLAAWGLVPFVCWLVDFEQEVQSAIDIAWPPNVSSDDENANLIGCREADEHPPITQQMHRADVPEVIVLAGEAVVGGGTAGTFKLGFGQIHLRAKIRPEFVMIFLADGRKPDVEHCAPRSSR
jgi:hypothetical protein